jgi:hypothetical protein
MIYSRLQGTSSQQFKIGKNGVTIGNANGQLKIFVPAVNSNEAYEFIVGLSEITESSDLKSVPNIEAVTDYITEQLETLDENVQEAIEAIETNLSNLQEAFDEFVLNLPSYSLSLSNVLDEEEEIMSDRVSLDLSKNINGTVTVEKTTIIGSGNLKIKKEGSGSAVISLDWEEL